MIEEIATVVAVDNNQITVKSTVKSTCHSCVQGDDCGSGIVAKAIPQKALEVAIESDMPAKVGDQVVLGIPEQQLMATALQVYLWPLIGLMLFAGLGQYFLQQSIINHELLAVLFAVVGGYLGFLLARYRQSRDDRRQWLQPKILRNLTQQIPVTPTNR